MRENAIKYAKKYGILAALVVVELILLIMVGSRYGKEKLHMDLPYTDLIGTTAFEDRDGWYMDTTFPSTESGLFDYTQNIALKRGTYDITVRYETDTNSNYCTTTATTKYFRGLRTDKVPMVSKVNELTYTIYLLEDVENFRIETYFGRNGYMIIKGFTVQETGAYARIQIFFILLLSLIVDLLYLAHKNQFFKRVSQSALYSMIGVAAVALLASVPAMGEYMIQGDDMGFHLLRIEGIKEGILSGQFPVRIGPNWMYGYGYPTSVYYGDIFLYIAAFFRLIGFSVHTSYNILVLCINFATAAIMYWCLKKITKNYYIAILGTILYTLAPYRLTDMYYRCALGESLAIVFLPLVVYGMYVALAGDIKDKKFKFTWIPLAIGLSGVVESHTLTCIMCAVFIIPLCIIKMKRVFVKERFLVLAKSVIYTMLLNMWFIFPCVSSMKGIEVVSSQRLGWGGIQHTGLYLSQMFSFLCNKDRGTPELDTGLSTTMPLGVGFTMGLGLVMYLLLRIKFRDSEWGIKLKKTAFFFYGSLVAIFMTTIYFPWDFLKEILGKHSIYIVNMQLSWRFLAIANVLLVWMIALSLKVWLEAEGRKVIVPVVAIFTVLSVLAGIHVIDSRVYSQRPFWAYDIEAMGRTDNNAYEYLIEGTDTQALVPNQVTKSEGLRYDDYEKTYLTVCFTCENESGETGYIELPLLWYENYRAIDSNGQKMEVEAGDNNVVRVIVPPGYFGDVTVKYHLPFSWHIAEMISICSLAVFCVWYVYEKRKEQRWQMKSLKHERGRQWQKS
ncbi:MAG: hypothetical protein HDQ99_16700 [Lachnospiraceae bacterium]|nr:hypothetical protein [Lachnospiraceae bacterium]